MALWLLHEGLYKPSFGSEASRRFWSLSGWQEGARPCFKTLCSFRSTRMQDLVDSVLKRVLWYLVEHEYIDVGDLYIDGSKWQAHANRYTIQWRKNTERHKGNVLARIDAFIGRNQGVATSRE